MRTLFLLDIDCFFASVEMALHPELRGKPLCVGGRRGERGIVACPNYEARAYGVKTAMPLRTAERLLPPDAVFLPGSHRVYGEYSKRVMDILYAFTPDIEQVSVDEAYMDVTGCLHFWKHPGDDAAAAARRMAAAMQDRIRRECGLGVSIGIGSTRVCAKIAASLKKPNGLVLVPHGGEKEFLSPLPVEMVPGIGTKTLPRMHARGIVSIGDLLRWQEQSPSLGGRYLASVAEGREDRVAAEERVEQSISRDHTFGRDTDDGSLIAAMLYHLVERCCKTLRQRGRSAATVTTRVRFADFTTVQKQAAIRPAEHEEEVFRAAHLLLQQLLPAGALIRLVGVKVSGLADARGAQLELGVAPLRNYGELHRRLDALQAKYGSASVRWGRTWNVEAVGEERGERA